MREILFRGKRKSNGEWVEGNFVTVLPVDMPTKYRKPKAVIFPINVECNWFNKYFYRSIEVDLETVGQYTGLTDKNGKKIFEGDIIRYTRTNMYAPSCSFHKQDLVSLHLVLWDSSVSAFVQQHHSLNEKRIVGKGSAVLYDDRAKENIVEVIGNIHDNPELLGGAK